MWAFIDVLREFIIIVTALVAYDVFFDETILTNEALPGAVLNILLVYILFSLYTRRHHRPHLDPHLHVRRWPRTLALLATGTGIGLVLGGAALALDVYAGAPYVPAGPPEALSVLIASDLAPSFNEEVLFRASLLRILFAAAGLLPALLASTVAYGLVNALVPGITVWTALLLGVETGLLFGCAYLLTGSVWLPAGLHVGWSLAQSIVYRYYVLAIAEGSPLGRHLETVAADGTRLSLEDGWSAVVVGSMAGLAALLLLLRALRRRELALEPPAPERVLRAVPA